MTLFLDILQTKSLYSALAPMRIIDGGILAPKVCEVAMLDCVRAIDIDEPWNRQDLRLCVPMEDKRVSPGTRRLLAYLADVAKTEPKAVFP